KRDLFIRERPDINSANADGPDGNTLPQKRHAQYCPNTVALDRMPDVRIVFFAAGQHVIDVDSLPVENGAATRGTATYWSGLSKLKRSRDDSIGRPCAD